MGDGDGMGRPLSPILGNETGDDDAEVAVIPGGKVEVPPLGGRGRGGFIRKSLSKFASSSSSIPFSPISAARTRGVTSLPTRISQPYGTRPDEQIHITGFTMVRFTTGQILEDDHSIAWYQLAPHELVELHGSRPQRGFSVAVQLAQLLEVKRGPGGVLVLGGEGAVGAEEWWEDLGGEETKSPGGAAANKVTAHGTSTTSANNNNNANPHEKSTSTNTATATTAAAPINPYSVVLTSLARHDLNAYIQPYWEGWVQCLRVAWRPDTVSSGIASGVRGVGPYGVGGEDVEEGGRGGERKKTDRQMEWQERWVVIRDGWVYLCKKRDVSCFYPFVLFIDHSRSFFFILFILLPFPSLSALHFIPSTIHLFRSLCFLFRVSYFGVSSSTYLSHGRRGLYMPIVLPVVFIETIFVPVGIAILSFFLSYSFSFFLT